MSSRRAAAPGGFTLSGPGVDRAYPDGGGVALSAAITHASRSEMAATFYVRDPAGEIFGRAERDEHGNVRVFRIGEAR